MYYTAPRFPAYQRLYPIYLKIAIYLVRITSYNVCYTKLLREYILVNGNQTATLLTWYIIKKWKENNKLTGNEYIVKTIVTSELLKEIAEKNGVEYFDVYTGFKWIAKVIRDRNNFV